MISRKERKIQKALGLGDDMPPTIWKRTADWWCHITVHLCVRYKWAIDEFWRWFAFKIPKKLVYHVTIRLWAHATMCPSGCKEDVHDTTVDNALERWEKE